jgi:hypothetical protein
VQKSWSDEVISKVKAFKDSSNALNID